MILAWTANSGLSSWGFNNMLVNFGQDVLLTGREVVRREVLNDMPRLSVVSVTSSVQSWRVPTCEDSRPLKAAFTDFSYPDGIDIGGEILSGEGDKKKAPDGEMPALEVLDDHRR